MSETVEERLQSARQRQQDALRLRATMEANQDAVKAKRDELLLRLKELGFDSPDEALAEVSRLSEEVDTLLAQIERLSQ